jgi:hypothetical protein
MMREHPDAYSANADVRVNVTRLRDQITSPARTILLLLLAAAGVVFIIACSNVANLILARSVRREGELAVRAALGASPGALRRTLLAESLVLCGAGAALGVLLARPSVSLVAQFASRFTVRALDVTVDNTVLFVGAGLALVAAILLAYVPRLPSSLEDRSKGRRASNVSGLGLGSSSLRITPGTSRRLRRQGPDSTRGRSWCSTWRRRSRPRRKARHAWTGTRTWPAGSASFRALTASRAGWWCPGATATGG